MIKVFLNRLSHLMNLLARVHHSKRDSIGCRSLACLGLSVIILSTSAQENNSLSVRPMQWQTSPIDGVTISLSHKYYLDAAGWNGSPIGLWSNGTTLWVTDWFFSKLFAYALSGTRLHAKDISSLVSSGNRSSRGLWSNGQTIWVSDDFEDSLFAYDLRSGLHIPALTFDTLGEAGNLAPNGIWSNGEIIWVADAMSDRIHAYDLTTKQRLIDAEIVGLAQHGNTQPRDMWSDGTTLWVADTGQWSSWSGWVYGKIYAYDLKSRNRDATRDIDFQSIRDGGVESPAGIWSNGQSLWISDWRSHGVFTTPLPPKRTKALISDPETKLSKGLLQTFALARNQYLSGIWSDGVTLWLSDLSQKKIFAYSLSNGERKQTQDLSSDTLAAAGNESPTGLWGQNGILYVLDDIDAQVYAYDLSTQSALPESYVTNLALNGNQDPKGMWSDGTTLWITDWVDGEIYAYDLSDGSPLPQNNITTLQAAENEHPTGLWSDGKTMWVADWGSDAVFAYDLLTGMHLPQQRVPSLRQRGNQSPSGIWSDGQTLWVSDFADASVYTYWLDEPPAAIHAIRLTQTGEVEIEFTGQLTRCDSMNGVYESVEGASSPYLFSPQNSQRFFMAR